MNMKPHGLRLVKAQGMKLPFRTIRSGLSRRRMSSSEARRKTFTAGPSVLKSEAVIREVASKEHVFGTPDGIIFKV
ncbi:hypothetical protein SY83_15740 [Paenibacillus swuensis]|uniref:Uncharacterized protein n=1 Tax=Paenibacillus swuensis TaxID=1178515 RepID=A0A172TL40_9BACL|nr:hypothetical protein [Paenibacillus swuensis]ANE47493.1 hypothetical protein SY83_15740 [Paenibacillus swuensis]